MHMRRGIARRAAPQPSSGVKRLGRRQSPSAITAGDSRCSAPRTTSSRLLNRPRRTVPSMRPPRRLTPSPTSAPAHCDELDPRPDRRPSAKRVAMYLSRETTRFCAHFDLKIAGAANRPCYTSGPRRTCPGSASPKACCDATNSMQTQSGGGSGATESPATSCPAMAVRTGRTVAGTCVARLFGRPRTQLTRSTRTCSKPSAFLRMLRRCDSGLGRSYF